MDLQQLKYFVAVARTEHMTRAAKELHVAQPALSAMISKLEAHLGVPLFDRNGRNIQLNLYGKAFLKKVELALSTLEDGQREIADLAEMEQNGISVLVKSASYYPEMFRSFRSLYPQTIFRITQTSNEEESIQLLETGEIDLYFATPPIQKTGIAGIELWKEEIFLAVYPSHHFAERGKISLIEASNEAFISLKAGCSIRFTLEHACKAVGFSPNIVCELDDSSSIGKFVEAGLGVAFLSGSAQQQHPNVKMLQIEEPLCYVTLQLAWMESRYLPQAVRTFRDYAIEYFTSLI